MRSLGAFLEGFVLPLAQGGVVHVGAPLGARALLRFLDGKPEREPLAGRVAEARRAVAAELLPEAPSPPLDEESLRIAIALHDLLFLAHPAAEAVAVRASRRREVAEGTAALATLAGGATEEALVGRHSLLHLAPRLARTDAEVVFWAGRRAFRGQPVPPRLVAWPELRRVHETRQEVRVLEEAALDPVSAPALRALLLASPLTLLLEPDAWPLAPARLLAQPAPDLRLLAGLRGSPGLCRTVAYRWLDSLDALAPALAAAAIALLAEPLQDNGSTGTALATIAHLHLCLLAGPDSAETVRRLGSRREAGARDLLALFPALLAAAPALALPPDVARDPRLRPRVDAHAAACAALAPARAAELAARIERLFAAPARIAAR